MIDLLAGPTVIVIQSDHGGGQYFHANSPEYSCIKERYGNLFAAYSSERAFRDHISERLNKDYNTVNIYRDIFSVYFDAGISPLEDRSYFSQWTKMRLIAVDEERRAEPCRAFQG